MSTPVLAESVHRFRLKRGRGSDADPTLPADPPPIIRLSQARYRNRGLLVPYPHANAPGTENYLQRTGTFKPSVLVDVANYAGWPLLVIYCFSMFAYPWLAGSWSWRFVQEVWDRWQTFNAGALAFAASLIAFNISRFNETRQRERDFVASKAFLPSTLSGLMAYCTQSARVLDAMWQSADKAANGFESPTLPADYRDVFANCIRHADPAIGSYLSNILVRLQVHDARMRDAIVASQREHERVVNKHTVITYVLRLGELYVLMSNLFSFARGEEEFETRTLVWDDFRTAYSILDLEIDDLYIDEKMNLQAFTKRWLDRAAGKSAETAE